jgi:hypothetical protein
MHPGTLVVMTKVIQVRDVPDRVHAALVAAAAAQGLSLTSYLQRELRWLADRPAIVSHNLDVVRATRANVQVAIDDREIGEALAEGRAER